MKKNKLCFSFISLVSIIIVWKLICVQSDVKNFEEIGKDEFLLNENIAKGDPRIFCVTPTYWRHVQKAELIRVFQTLTLVSQLFSVTWIVIEDSEQKTDLVKNLLKRVPNTENFQFVHLNVKTPPFQQLKAKDPRWKKHRGVEQRNAALSWLRSKYKPNDIKGVVYFMDDDNTYDILLFQEIAKVKRVGVWPVGLVGGFNLETPVINPSTGKVVNYTSGWRPERPFAIDMAGFAINIDLILVKNEAGFSYKMEHGLQESEFLSKFTTKENLEPLAEKCTKVYVWHTRTENPKIRKVVEGFEV